MISVALIPFLVQTVLLGCAVTLAYWMRAPWLALAGLGLVWTTLIFFGTRRAIQRPRFGEIGVAALGSSTLVVIGGVLLGRRDIYLSDFYNAVVAWLVAAAILLTSHRVAEDRCKRQWRIGFASWTVLGAVIWTVASYLDNNPPAFYFGVLAWLTLLILCRIWFRFRSFGIQAANTLILLVVLLPLFDLLVAPKDHFDMTPKLAERAYAYEVARKDPAAFARWNRYVTSQCGELFGKIFVPQGGLALRSNVEASFFGSRISINSKGFRGKQIADDKADAYRIVVLGESTTFGLTMGPEGRPWPEILEQTIRERLNPSRPFQVINAGVPGYTLKMNLDRIPQQILPLHPDMIISYHGKNGFSWLYDGLPPIHGKPPPSYRQRPMKLLGDFEYKVRMNQYRRQYALKSVPHPAFVSSPMETKYAQQYRQLIKIARTNRIRLVLATYSMAANDRSQPGLVEFYRSTDSAAEWEIKANLTHSAILRQLAKENPDIGFIDTCPVLDGKSDNFYDLCHFTSEGEQKMAETFFAGVRITLEKDLTQTNTVPQDAAPGIKASEGR